MRHSVGIKIAVYMIVFSIVIIGIIGVATKFFLPDYYMNRQLSLIEEYSQNIRQTYEDKAFELTGEYMEALRNDVGGELYLYSYHGQSMGYGMGKGKNAVMSKNMEIFIPEGDFTQYTYENKVGLEIYALGVRFEDEYLVFEVGLQSLDKATDVIVQFIWVLLIVVLVIAVMMSLLLSKNIAKPIRRLKNLADDMKSKKVKAIMVTKNQDEIGQLNVTLNELYEELLSSIYQLESELKKERNAENLKKRFLAQATHELKTPISVIRGYSEILYDGMYKDEEERDRYLKNIYEESESISHLILDVLDYTKMETGNYQLVKERIHAKPFFENLIKRYSDYIYSNGLNVEVTIDIDEVQLITIDQKRIEQVFKNLISNACEHATSEMTIDVQALGNRVRLSVTNNGPIIEPEDLPYIFDSFYKKKGKQTGTGLGLAILKEIVIKHEGDYRVENLDNGVRFVVTI